MVQAAIDVMEQDRLVEKAKSTGEVMAAMLAELFVNRTSESREQAGPVERVDFGDGRPARRRGRCTPGCRSRR